MTKKRTGVPADASKSATPADGTEPDLSTEEAEPVAPPAAAAVAAAASTPSGVDAAVVAAFEEELADALRRADEEGRRADDSWDRYLRAEAELENYRRRAERQREDTRFQARRDLLARFLEVGDNLERALGHSHSDPAQVVEGVEATYRELSRLLAREGVEPIAALEAPFDPALHEAISVIPVPGLAAEQVVAVERVGYTLNGELLRPARVVVGQPA